MTQTSLRNLNPPGGENVECQEEKLNNVYHECGKNNIRYSLLSVNIPTTIKPGMQQISISCPGWDISWVVK